MSSALSALLFAACLCAPQPEAKENASGWMQFRGPNGSGVVSGNFALPDKLDPATNLVWKTAVPLGHSSPIVVEDAIFLTAYEPSKLLVISLELESGRERWRRELPVEDFEKTYEHGPASCTPASDGQRIFAAFGSFGLIAFDLEGKELWRHERSKVNNTFGSASSPVVVDGKLIVVRSDQQQSHIQALEPGTGRVIWDKLRDGPASSWSTPVEWRSGDDAALLVYEPFHLRCLSLDDGAQLWTVPGLADEPITVPQLAGGLIYTTSYNLAINKEAIGLPTFEVLLKECDADGDGQISAEESRANKSVLSRPDADGDGDHPLRIFIRMLDANKDGQIAADEYPRLKAWLDGMKHANGFIALRPSDVASAPELAWQTETGVPECPTPVLWEDRIYAVRNGGVMTCLDAKTGEELYRGRAAPGGPYYASPVVGDGKIYLASERGIVTIVSTAAEPEVVFRGDLEEPIWATPALVPHGVILRSEGNVWCFGTAD